MAITNLEIAQLLELQRKHTLDLMADSEASDPEMQELVGRLYDRAQTRTLLAMWPGSQNGAAPVADASAAVPSRRVKPGSKKARDRAVKAAATRRANKAAGQAQAAADESEVES